MISSIIFNKYSRFKASGIESMITIEVVIVEKFKVKIAKKIWNA